MQCFYFPLGFFFLSELVCRGGGGDCRMTVEIRRPLYLLISTLAIIRVKSLNLTRSQRPSSNFSFVMLSQIRFNLISASVDSYSHEQKSQNSQYHFVSWSLSLVSCGLGHSSLCGVCDEGELTLETLNKEGLQYFICKKRLIWGLGNPEN